VPLARAGYHVTAVDSSSLLLFELRRLGEGLPIRLVAGDLVGFRQHVSEAADLILCMGDTLTHLPDYAHVERLFGEVAAALAPEGRLLLTFRDYTVARVDGERFVPVRSDAQRILTCFLEEEDEHMLVHDLVHERVGDGWQLRVSSYRKLRLSPAWVVAALQRVGLEAEEGRDVRGMVRIRARLQAVAEEP
jgi:SAM-dependent methyltransferase